ncbi:MAG: xylulokinase [Chloroflexi bacterium]|nr:xylulokinase [Chloroflexota bacterium]MBV9893380.1 xylulokinase [Chloroflexota bacterium]
MTRRAFLGIDCGTQSTKALLVDAETDAVLGIGRASHELIEGLDGTREQHPDWWINALISATRAAIEAAGPVEVSGIGVSGQQHGLVCLGSDDKPVRASKLWNDTTTVQECALLTDSVGGMDRALALTGNAFLPGYTAPKVLWMKRNAADAYAATRRMCLPHDYLNLWLTGAFATEPGDASGTAYFDARSRQYSETVLTVMDSERDWAATLPPLVESLSVVGGLREFAAQALGIAAGAPISGGGGDNMMAAIGVGAVCEGPVVVSLGTSGTAFAYRSQPAVDPLGEAAAFCDSTGAWLPLVCTLNCTVATDWIARLFGLDHAGVEAALSASPPGARGLTFLPHLSGERTPNTPTGAGVFAGLRAEHTSQDLVRAVVEGVTFGLRYALGALERSGVRATQVTLVGGGAASDAWAQLCADVFRVTVLRPPETEAAAIGAARQVRWAVDRIPVESTATDGIRFEPHPSSALEAAAARADHLRQVAIQNAL